MAIKAVPYVDRQFVGEPYRDSGYGRNLTALFQQRGRDEAAIHLQRGDNAARLWQGAGNAITNAVAGWQDSVEQRRRAEIEAARESRAAEAQGLQLESARMSLGEAKRQAKGRETARNVLPLARRENGVYGVDRDLIAREMEAAGHADMLPDIMQGLDEQEASHLGVLEARRDAIAGDAWRVLQSGADAERVDGLLDLWEKNDLAPKADLDAFRKVAKTDPEQALLAAVRSSPKGVQMLQQMQAAQQPKLHNVPEGGTVIDERTGEVVFQGQPKTPANIEAAILAETDPTKRAELIALKEQLVKAGRQPAGPGPVEPLHSVIGPDGEAVLVPRSQAVGKKPASNREVGRQVTSGDANDIADFNTALDDMTTLRTALAETSATGTIAKVGASVPNWLTEYTGWGSDAKKKQALIDRIKQTFGKTLEGGVLRKEDEAKYTKILPTIGDPNEVVVEKIAGLEAAMKKRQQRKLDALEDAGYDTTKFRARPSAGGAAPKTIGRFTVEEEP